MIFYLVFADKKYLLDIITEYLRDHCQSRRMSCSDYGLFFDWLDNKVPSVDTTAIITISSLLRDSAALTKFIEDYGNETIVVLKKINTYRCNNSTNCHSAPEDPREAVYTEIYDHIKTNGFVIDNSEFDSLLKQFTAIEKGSFLKYFVLTIPFKSKPEKSQYFGIEKAPSTVLLLSGKDETAKKY